MGLSYKTFNYIPGFSCLGAECEDTCCKDWEIRFDRPHFELLKKTVEEHGGEQAAKFSRQIKLNNSETASDHNYALLELLPDGSCPFLLADGWCELHKQFGVAPLSNVCAFYPRVLSRHGDTIEMSGALSCPEMVRKCLFDSNEVEMVDFQPSILPRPDDYQLTRELDLPADNFYYDQFFIVREILFKLSMLEGFGLNSRLYFLSNFANRLNAFYYLDTETTDTNLLASELKQALSVSMLERMDDYVSKYDTAEPIAIIVIQAVLQLRLQQFPHETYSHYIERIVSDYREAIPALAGNDLPGEALPPDLLWQQYQKRRELLDKYFGDELDRCFTRYLINCLFREWFITMPDLFTYIHMLVIRLAILRFLVYSHPQIYQLASQLDAKGVQASGADITTLRKLVVEVIYLNSRAIDHNTVFLKVVYDAIHEQQMMNYEYSLPFIKF